jgi:hypothetical protein
MGDRSIVLADSTTITVKANRANETALAKRLYPMLSSRSAEDWTEVDGVLTVRRVDLSSQHASRWLRIVQVPESGPAWFSDIVDLKHIAGNAISLDVTLNPGVRVEGRLADTVPRPVRNGRPSTTGKAPNTTRSRAATERGTLNCATFRPVGTGFTVRNRRYFLPQPQAALPPPRSRSKRG